MGLDQYKVEVLHYINPYLIWVLVRKGDENAFHFEQIGTYGILPKNLTIGVDYHVVDYVIKAEQCDEWMPAANVAMNKCFQDAAEVWFVPTYIDKKSSIFHTHKYGDLLVIKKNGEEVNVIEEILNSNFGHEDHDLFYQELRSNNLQTELDFITLQQVSKKIKEAYRSRGIPKDIWLSTFEKQINQVQHEDELLESAVPPRKLKFYDDISKSQINQIQPEGKPLQSGIPAQKLEVCDDNINTLPMNKLNVLKFCKDIDEVSVGRASSRKSAIRSPNQSGVVSMAFRRKMEWLESHSVINQPKQASKPESEMQPANIHAADGNEQNLITMLKKKTNNLSDACSLNSTISSQSGIHSLTLRKKLEWLESQSIDKQARKPEANNSESRPAKMHAADGKMNDQNNNEDENNTNNRTGPRPPMDSQPRLVAYGPEGLQINKFIRKLVTTNEQKEEPVVQETRKPEPEFQVKKSEDVYANTDSEVNLKISNLALLKRIKCHNSIQDNSGSNNCTKLSVRRKVKYLEEKQARLNDSISSVSDKDSSKCELDSDSESITGLEEKLGLNIKKIKKPDNLEQQSKTVDIDEKKSNVNPYKNVDGSISIFVDKLVIPVLMVHTKKNNRIEPVSNMRDIPFGNDIHMVLRNMGVQKPMRPQTVSWPTILRGHSFFLVGPHNSGNTMGYLPAVCRLVNDFKNTHNKFGLSCIIVCATSHSVAAVEFQCKMFLHTAKIFACFVGMSDLHITTSLLNGCDLLICTPSMLVRLIQEDFSLDFRSLSTFVIDDCDYISSIYPKELKFCLVKVMDIVKNRPHKEWKVQYVIISRTWCDFMSSLARKAPDSVVCISAFQECVLYSKAATSVDFVAQEKKITTVTKFLEGIDRSKKTVIVCKADDEVKQLEKVLTKLDYVVFSCDSTMTVQDLYNLDKILVEYQEPVSGPILVCCDGNLTHLNVTDAHYLIHYSLPDLFSMFCKRFAVLIDNYTSIFKGDDTNIKIKILFDSNNIEQLPKTLQFIKRCTQDVPPFLDEISASVMDAKYLNKAQNSVPICRRLLTLGKCPDYWNCVERHAIFKEFDTPKPWLPTDGIITFQLLHYHSAVYYSARITSSVVNGNITKYPQTYSLLSIKLGMHYSKDENRKLHGVPKVGDVCAVTLKQNLFVRCQVAKVLQYDKDQPTFFLIKLIDEEKYETARDTSLYYLPDDLKNIETHVVTVILANLTPQDKDVTFSNLAENQLKRFTDDNEEIYMRGQITMVVGNTILVDTLEVCQDLSSLEEVVVKCDFRKELLDGHAIPNPEHIENLKNVCDYFTDIPKENVELNKEVANAVKTLPKASWAHLENDDFSSVFFMYAENPSQFFVRPVKFDDCMNTLIKDIKMYVSEHPDPIDDIVVGDIVLAEFPDDATNERARIESNVNNDMVKCFFVDQGEWRHISPKKIFPITEKLITQLPFQAIECRLAGVQSPGDSWTDFSTNFFVDLCYDSVDNLKQLYIKYFTKEKAEFTEGHKYGVVLIDTYSEEDIIINQMLVDKNLARENEDYGLLNDLVFERKSEESFNSDTDDEITPTVNKVDKPLLVNDTNKLIPFVPNKFTRSVPLVDFDINLDDFELVSDGAGKVCNIPVSELLQVREQALPKTNDQAAASLTEDFVPQNKSPKLNVITESTDQTSKPKVLWRQNKNTVTIKIKLIVDNYDLTIKERYMKFSAEDNSTNYGFDFELYGVVNRRKCCHCNKGQYIQITLSKVIATTWLTLTRDNEIKKWIVYDIESIAVSSDDESDVIDIRKNLVKHDADSDSDDNLQDDINFSY